MDKYEKFRKQLGDPSLEITKMEDAKPGINKINVQTMQYGYQSMIFEKEVPVKMSDGVNLYVNIYRPDKPGKFPVILSADAYGKDKPWQYSHPQLDTTRALWPVLGEITASGYCNTEAPDPGFWVPNDYVVIKVAVRGSSTSEGDLHQWTIHEAHDYAEVVEWAGVQEWSNGNVGTNGVSYLCVTQWFMAALNPPHLKAIIPWEGLNDVYREAAFHGGVPETGFFPMWNKLLGIACRNPDDMYGASLGEHHFFDEYWEERQAKLWDIKVPMLVCASWSTMGLHNRGSFEGFKQAASEDKWLYVHGRKEWEMYYRRENLEMQKQFFDYYLKGIENDWKDTPRVTLEIRDKFYKGDFRYENEWPIARQQCTRLYLNAGDMSLGEAPIENESTCSYAVDRGENEGEALFRLTFNEDTEITGNMNLKLWVGADGSDDMDLFVGVRKLDRRGDEVFMADFNHLECGIVAKGWLRVSCRELDPERSTVFQPWLAHKGELKLAEGEIVPVEVEILPSGTLFKKGETLELVVRGSDIVDFEATHGLVKGNSHTDTVNKGKHVIYTGGKYDSQLIVPVIPTKGM